MDADQRGFFPQELLTRWLISQQFPICVHPRPSAVSTALFRFNSERPFLGAPASLPASSFDCPTPARCQRPQPTVTQALKK